MPSSPSPAQRRKSYSDGAQVRGDRSRRVAVPLSGRLQDLEGHASRHFGLDRSTLRFHHRGGGKLEGDQHLSGVQAGDVIVAKGSKPRGPPLSTTFQNDYRPIKFEPPRRAPPRKEHTPVPFKGRSEYQERFPTHEISTPPRPPKRNPAPHVPFQATTEYQTNYPGHQVESPARAPRREQRPAVPFEGSSTYRQAYLAHDVPPPSPAPPRTPTPKVPFNGSSTYHSDFLGHRAEKSAPPPARQRAPAVPFEGSSEYRRNFVEQKVDVPKYVFIEPAIAD